MVRRWIPVALAALAAMFVAVGAIVAQTIEVSSNVIPARLQGIPANKIGPAEGRAISSGTIPPIEEQRIRAFRAAPRPTPTPDVCGAPSDSHGVMVQLALGAMYGPPRDCLLVGATWVVTTRGFPANGTTGVIALYSCSPSEQACLSATGPFVMSRWRIITPPNPGPVHVMLRMPDEPDVLIVAAGGQQYAFNVATASFTEKHGYLP